MDTYQSLFECSPDAVVVAGPRGLILKMNSRGEQMFGYPREEYAGQPVELLLPKRFAAGHVAQRDGYAAHPHVRSMGAGLELFARRKDGSEFPVDVMLSPVETPEGRLLLAVVRDITERKRAEEAQVSLIAQLQNALKEDVELLAVCTIGYVETCVGMRCVLNQHVTFGYVRDLIVVS